MNLMNFASLQTCVCVCIHISLALWCFDVLIQVINLQAAENCYTRVDILKEMTC